MTDNNLKMITINGKKYNNNITKFYLYNEKLTQRNKEALSNLTQLTELILYLNNKKLTELPKEICNLTQLTEIYLDNNELTELPKEICNLTQLTNLQLSDNNLTELPKEICNLTQLTYLKLTDNLLTELPKEIGNLTQLTYLNLSHNKLTELPLEIINLRILRNFQYYDNPLENLLNPIISRFIARIHEINNGITNTIYNDTQNIHSSSIQQSIKDSIFNLMKNYNDDYKLNYLSNPILTQKTKEALIEYSICTDIHSIMEITFEELLKAVFIEIDSLENKDEIYSILNQEMSDSICKCFTGRLSRLINCLNGFSDKVSIQISTNEEISNIIIVLKNKIKDVDELKKAIKVEMTERGYDKETIDIWIGYVE
jgi:Leucine-rich repeat (LRR) protein